MPDLHDVVPMSKLNEVVDEAATSLAGLHPDNAAAADDLCEWRPQLTDEQVRGLYVQFAARVKQRIEFFAAVARCVQKRATSLDFQCEGGS